MSFKDVYVQSSCFNEFLEDRECVLALDPK